MALAPALHEIDKPLLSVHALARLRRRAEMTHQGVPVRWAVALRLRRRHRGTRCACLLAVTRPVPGRGLRYLPSALRHCRRGYGARVTRDRRCALHRLARLSAAVGAIHPFPSI